MPQRRTELRLIWKKQAKRIWAIIGEVCPNRTYESLEHDFTFDHNPDKELDEVKRLLWHIRIGCKAFPLQPRTLRRSASERIHVEPVRRGSALPCLRWHITTSKRRSRQAA